MHAPCKRGTLGRQQARGARPTSVRLACGRTQAMHSRPAPYTMSMGSDEQEKLGGTPKTKVIFE
ncbi:hypothetical protein Csa_008021 [Cucumis sativus]|uniref:Uncharacterized protein n=1 Tax=Cucumis sativus TaxID=3659 RepID=A0A0A0KN61_CUCSA|nr:hypothetical protein Csa_008021 [Cucumis sativus]